MTPDLHLRGGRPAARTAAWSLAGLLGLAACGSDDPLAIEISLAACRTVDDVTLTAGAAPSIQWAPDCGVAALTVYPANGGDPLWEVVAGNNALQGPLVYGSVPPGALRTRPAEALLPGTSYVLELATLEPVPPGSDWIPHRIVWRQPFTR